MYEEIYHYTSFETLKKIIENKSFRFGSLEHVDDAEEGVLLDFASHAPYTFVSCWTKSPVENIPLWTMYVDSPFAVRIGVSPEIIKPKFIKKHFLMNHSNREAYVTLIDRGGERGMEFFSDVVYQQAPVLSLCKDLRGTFTNEYINNFGLTKSTHWAFQEEVRYIVQAVPLKAIKKRRDASLYTLFQEAIINTRPTDIEYIDIDYEPQYLVNANFMLGPATTEADRKTLVSYLRDEIPGFKGNISRSEVLMRK